MPTYEYKCNACGHQFERFQTMSSAPIKRCPECGKAKVRRLIGTGAGLIFKGSGFYITDYRSEAYKDAAKTESGASSDSKSDSKSTDNKPAGDAKPATDAKPAAKESKTETKKTPAAKSAKKD